MRGVPETVGTWPPPIRIAKTFLAGQPGRIGPRDLVYICGLPGATGPLRRTCITPVIGEAAYGVEFTFYDAVDAVVFGSGSPHDSVEVRIIPGMLLGPNTLAVAPSPCSAVAADGGAALLRWEYVGEFGFMFFSACVGLANGTCRCTTALDANVRIADSMG
jgi:hypothetical protein